jgi:hypothetical protein
MALKFCAETGCPGIAETGMYCPAHQNASSRNPDVKRPNDPWYARAAWKGKYGVRRAKIRRDPLCEKCGAIATEIHHTRDEWKETRDWFLFMGGYNMEFLQSLCARCHSGITMDQIKERGLRRA